jgi:4'-phosphopantetheinyl transferase
MPEEPPPAPATYAMRVGEVHVWKLALASANDGLGDFPGLLSVAEQERAGRFHFERDHARFVSCRASLRLLLSRYTGISAAEIVLRYEPQGKPILAGAAGWQFNVSHSRDVAAVAISRFDPVGIDIELIDPEFPRADVAGDIFASDELRALSALSPSDQAIHFFHLWTLKEALLKAVGGGFTLDPRDIRIRLDGELRPEIVSAPPEFLHASLSQFTLQPGFAAALAVLARVSRVAFFEFRP